LVVGGYYKTKIKTTNRYTTNHQSFSTSTFHMPQVFRLRTIISRHFKISNEEAGLLIGQGKVRVNGKPVSPAAKVEYWEEISVNGKIIREATRFSYIKFYKPGGIECTLNPEIENNLLTVFKFPKKLFPVGRLDKDSEGLLLLTDDGRIFKNVAASEKEKEKEYIVKLDRAYDESFISQMQNGIVIMGKKTREAKVFPVNDQPDSFRIILTQGLNRQIRNKLGYKVEELIRVRIVNVKLGNLKTGEWVELSEDEMKELF
jgi:23S rRNA pseudouridine2604 synthase